MEQTYFDAASTTRISEAALSTYLETSRTLYGNPSSIHETGKKAKACLTENRSKAADLLGLKEYDIVFTGGASESNSIVLSSLLWKRQPGELLVSPLEHPSVTGYKTLLKEKGFTWKTFAAPRGLINVDKLIDSLTEQTQMVTISAVHNILGTIQPVEEIYKRVKAFNPDIHIHLDATQAVGKVLWDSTHFPCDSLALSAHKIHGPRGIGLLALRKNAKLRPLSAGGGQENSMRGGTENLPAIAAYVTALEEALTDQEIHLSHLSLLRSKLGEHLERFTPVRFLSPKDDSSAANIVSVSTPLPSEVFLRMMNDKGFALSASSACSNNSKNKQLLDKGITGFTPKETSGAVRISWDRYTTEDDIDRLCQAIKETLGTQGRH